MSKKILSVYLHAIILSLVSFLTVFVGILVMSFLEGITSTAFVLLAMWVVPLLIFPIFLKNSSSVRWKYGNVLIMFVSMVITLVLVVFVPRFEWAFEWIFTLHDENSSVELIYAFYSVHCLVVEVAWMLICWGKARKPQRQG